MRTKLSMPNFCVWNRITHVIPFSFRAITANKKLEHNVQTQKGNGIQAMWHYTDRCCMSTFVRSVGRRKMGLRASGNATCSTVETKTIWYTPSLAHCEVVLITSHFTRILILCQMFIFMNMSGLRKLKCRKVSKVIWIAHGFPRPCTNCLKYTVNENLAVKNLINNCIERTPRDRIWSAISALLEVISFVFSGPAVARSYFSTLWSSTSIWNDYRKIWKLYVSLFLHLLRIDQSINFHCGYIGEITLADPQG